MYCIRLSTVHIFGFFFPGNFVNKPTAKFPYKRVQEYGDLIMEGLPPGVELEIPSKYDKDTLIQILNIKHRLRLRGITYGLT